MRKIILSAALCLVAATFNNEANAQASKTFYVCSGTSFTLKSSVSTHTNYQWDEVGGASLGTDSTASITAPTLSGTTYDTKRYTLTVRDAAGCWSDKDTFTVHILPPIVATIAGNAGPYCANNATSVTLTANVATLTLPTGVSANQYAWTAGGSATGTNSNTLTFTTGTTGSTTYNVAVTYSLPSGIGGSKLTSCNGSATSTVVVNTAPTTPTVTIQ